MSSGSKLPLNNLDCSINIRKYQSHIRLVMYAMLGTRPNIGYSIATLSQYSSNPGKEHWVAINCLLRYLSSTKDFKLIYDGNFQTNDQFGYSDSDWASDPRDY